MTDALLESLARSVAQALGGGKEPLQSAEIRTDLMWAGALVGNDLLQAVLLDELGAREQDGARVLDLI